jgi:hypothetical protein
MTNAERDPYTVPELDLVALAKALAEIEEELTAKKPDWATEGF